MGDVVAEASSLLRANTNQGVAGKRKRGVGEQHLITVYLLVVIICVIYSVLSSSLYRTPHDRKFSFNRCDSQ